MPMFEVDHADKLKLRDCTTSAETMVKVTGRLGSLDAQRCEAGGDGRLPPADKRSFLKRFINKFFNKSLSFVYFIVSTVVAGLALAYFTDLLKLPG